MQPDVPAALRAVSSGWTAAQPSQSTYSFELAVGPHSRLGLSLSPTRSMQLLLGSNIWPDRDFIRGIIVIVLSKYFIILLLH